MTMAPHYFTAIGTDHAPQDATDPSYEYAGLLAAAVAATSNDVETMKATIWASTVTLAATGVDPEHIIGTLAAALAIFAVEIFNPAVDIVEELSPGLDYREAIGRASGPETANTPKED